MLPLIISVGTPFALEKLANLGYAAYLVQNSDPLIVPLPFESSHQSDFK